MLHMKRVFALSLFGVALVPTLGTGLCLLFDEIKPAEIVYKSSRLKAMSMNEDDVKPVIIISSPLVSKTNSPVALLI